MATAPNQLVMPDIPTPQGAGLPFRPPLAPPSLDPSHKARQSLVPLCSSRMGRQARPSQKVPRPLALHTIHSQRASANAQA